MKPKGRHRALRRRSSTLSVLAVCVMVLGLLAVPGTAGADPHEGQSVDVVIIGGPIVYHGGTLPTTGPVGDPLLAFTFTSIAASSVNAATLALYDTAVLNVGSGGGLGMLCNVNNLSPTAKADLVAFVESGHKLIITDSECTPQDYSWLPYPFVTSNPGAQGASGTLTIVEDNLLSDNDSTNVHFIDAAFLGASTDAVGDMNVMTTYNPNWCLDMSGTNVQNVTGPVHTYAKTGEDVGLIIYNGLDLDYLGYSGGGGVGNMWLRKMWVQELQQPFNPSNLPCGFTVLGITLGPATAQNMVGEDHTVTATLADLLGNPQSGILVDFEVIAGPNAGTTGTCTANADCTTDAAGEVSFTYTGDGGIGTDQIEACFINAAGAEVCSQTVTKEWLNTPPIADPNGPYLFPLAAGPFDGSGSYDPDGDPLTYAWDFGDSGTGTGEDPSHTYADAGIYDVCLIVNDGLVDSEEVCTTAVIYDPSGGFVTGGGWIDSPAGAYYPQDLPFFDGSYYQLFEAAEIPWEDADYLVGQLSNPSCGYPHLATVTSAEEDEFLVDAFGELPLFGKWLGGFQADGSTAVDEGWGWVTGEPWDYTNWNGGEPNDSPTVGEDGEEQHLEYWDNGMWNDEGYMPLVTGYLVEYDACYTGKATFGFVSKYKKGASVPTGNTEFQFHTVGMNFHSESYDWLVVTGSNFAKFKGSGTINGDLAPTGEMYKFQIWAGDNDPDTFRIKIWYEDAGEIVVYDNGMNQPIGGGSIVIHTKK